MSITAAPAGVSPALREDDHERVVVRQDPATGLRLIVAVHSTVLGPSLGGLRLRRYPGGLREALDDVLGLSRTMTLKAAAAGLSLGGGKAVMLDDGVGDRREERLLAAAGVIDELAGAYITAEDIGTSTQDMDLIAERTRYVVGRSPEHGGVGDPSPVTAETVFQATLRALEAATGSDVLGGRRVGVVGLGKVGAALAGKLVGAGADVIAYDLDPVRLEAVTEELGLTPASSTEAILALELDVLAPCAAGGMIDEATAQALECRVVAGAANNPLTGREVARVLHSRGVLFVPDFLANCGGLIHVSSEWFGDDGAGERERIEHAMQRLEEAMAGADLEGLTPIELAERQALERVEGVRTAV